MARVLSFETRDGRVIRLEVDDDDTKSTGLPEGIRPKGGYAPAGKESDAHGKFAEVFDDIRVYANALAKKIGEIDMKPSEVEVSLGVTLTAETGIVFAKAGAEAEINIKLTWSLDNTGDEPGV